MKRLYFVPVLVVLALVGAVVVANARTAGAVAGTTIDVTAHLTKLGLVVDAKPVGASSSPGDSIYESGVILSEGKRIGRFGGSCIQLAGGNQQCVFTMGLGPKGQIIGIAGYGPSMNTSDPVLMAIVGGTGTYEGARGQVEDREVSDTDHKLRIHLMG